MKEKHPLSIKLSKELHARLIEAATRAKIKKHALADLAIEAAVDAIEKNDYRVVMPIQFEVTHVPVPKAESKYPPHQRQQSFIEDRIAKKKGDKP